MFHVKHFEGKEFAFKNDLRLVSRETLWFLRNFVFAFVSRETFIIL